MSTKRYTDEFKIEAVVTSRCRDVDICSSVLLFRQNRLRKWRASPKQSDASYRQ